MKTLHISLLLLLASLIQLHAAETDKTPIPGAYQIDLYRDIIAGKSVAIVANQTSMIGKTHLVDSLLSIGIDIKVIFAPEHGFRDLADAGEKIENGKDPANRHFP